MNENKTGHWERDNDRPRSWTYRCSECGEKAYYPVPKYFSKGCRYRFCPWCGARMDGDSVV